MPPPPGPSSRLTSSSPLSLMLTSAGNGKRPGRSRIGPGEPGPLLPSDDDVRRRTHHELWEQMGPPSRPRSIVFKVPTKVPTKVCGERGVLQGGGAPFSSLMGSLA